MEHGPQSLCIPGHGFIAATRPLRRKCACSAITDFGWSILELCYVGDSKRDPEKTKSMCAHSRAKSGTPLLFLLYRFFHSCTILLKINLISIAFLSAYILF